VDSSGLTIHWRDDSLTSGSAIARGENNCATVLNNIGEDVDGNSFLWVDRIVCDASGQHLMTRDNTGPTPIRSSDGGYSWAIASGLPPLVDIYFANPGDPLRWIAVAGTSTPLYSKDAGASGVWVNKQGNMTDIAALPMFKAVKVLP